MSEYCKQRVYRPGGLFTGGQCSRKVWKDGYCKIHHPDSVRERQKKSDERLANGPYNLLIKERDRVKELETQVESLKLKWTMELPSKVGWYWRRSGLYDEKMKCVEVRDYANRLAIDNCVIKDDDFWNRYEWAGPIPAPED